MLNLNSMISLTVPELHIVYPRESKDGHQVSLDVFGKSLKLKLLPNDGIRSDEHIVEHFEDSLEQPTKRYTGLAGRYTVGSVEGEEGSVAALQHNNKELVSSFRYR